MKSHGAPSMMLWAAVLLGLSGLPAYPQGGGTSQGGGFVAPPQSIMVPGQTGATPAPPLDETWPTSLGPPTGGELRILSPDGATTSVCPLKHTDVTADIIGYVARVKVKQSFSNPTDRKIEAIYVFPLPHEAAVDEMTMVVGDRRIVGQIKPREEARAV